MGDLEIVLNKISAEYPALVREVLLSNRRDDLGTKCASISHSGYCYLISKPNLFIWKLSENGRKAENQVYKLQLPPSGLPYSTETVLLYSKGRSALPGVLAVSPEGAIRHWPILGGAHADTEIDLGNEVALSLQILCPFSEFVAVLLTTTSGSLFRVEGTESRDPVTCTRLGCVEQIGFTRRFSSLIFGGGNATAGAQVLRSIVVYQNGNAMEEDEEEEIDFEPLLRVVALSPTSISYFDPMDNKLLWTAALPALLASHASARLRDDGVRCAESPTLWLLDGLAFRSGVLLLVAVATENGGVELVLAYLQGLETGAPSRASALFVLRHPASQFFRATEESTFMGRVHLAMSEAASTLGSMLHTDGVAIIHSSSIQAVHLPDSLEKDRPLNLNGHITLHGQDRLLGYGCAEYAFILRVRAGIESIRLLPKGFEKDSVPEGAEEAVAERLSADGADSPEMSLFKAALLHFFNKRIADASSLFNQLLENDRIDLARLVYTFVAELLDSSSGLTSTAIADLQSKSLLFNRLLLFLKSMHVFETVCNSSLVVLPPDGAETVSRRAAVLLAEAAERFQVAVALSSFHFPVERQLLTDAARYASGEGAGGAASFEGTFLSKISSLHSFFPALTAVLSRSLRAAPAQIRVDLLSTASCILDVASNAISNCRRSELAVPVVTGSVLWTHGEVAKAYRDAAQLLLNELKEDVSEIGEPIKKKLKELMTKLIAFSLGEKEGRAEGDPLLLGIYELGDDRLALGLAERFKDFRLLVKITQTFVPDERRKYIENYKRRFAEDNFEMYLCEFYLKNNLTGELLEQRGERVEAFLAQHDTIRWRRQLQNGQYAEAAKSLLSAADNEMQKQWNRKMFLSLAYLSAVCADETEEEVAVAALSSLDISAHQDAIPSQLISLVFPDSPGRPLSLEEIVEVNLMAVETEEEKISGIMRALHVVACGIERARDEETSESLEKTLLSVWQHSLDSALYKVRDNAGLAATLLGKVLNELTHSKSMSASEKDSVLPSISSLLPSATPETTAFLTHKIKQTRFFIAGTSSVAAQ